MVVLAIYLILHLMSGITHCHNINLFLLYLTPPIWPGSIFSRCEYHFGWWPWFGIQYLVQQCRLLVVHIMSQSYASIFRDDHFYVTILWNDRIYTDPCKFELWLHTIRYHLSCFGLSHILDITGCPFYNKYLSHFHTLGGINKLPRYTMQPSSVLRSHSTYYLLKSESTYLKWLANFEASCWISSCSIPSLNCSSCTMDICTGAMYGDVLYCYVKTFHFHLFMWIDHAECICECNLSFEIDIILKTNVVVP